MSAAENSGLGAAAHQPLTARRKNRIIIIISLLLVVGFLATSLASFFVSRSSLREEITQNELPLTSDNIYSEIQRDLLRPIFISSLMASDTFLRDWVIQGEKDSSKIIRYLREIKSKYDTRSSFFVSERTRNYYYPEGILKKVHPDAERDRWYFRVRDMPTDYEINVDPDMANADTITIFINYRVFDYDGNYIGATGVGLPVHAVKALILSYQERYNRNIYFTDRSGIIRLYGESAFGPIRNVRKMEGLAPLADRILSTPSTTLNFTRDGRTIHLSTRFIPEFDWYLFVEQAEEETLRQILHTLFINMGICLVITVLVILLVNIIVSSYQRQLEKMVITDQLTGIHNRRAFDIVMDQALKESDREGAPLSLILFDIDHFKQINDKFGHPAGDAVLREIVRIAQGQIRNADILCRWGGEEFSVLLKHCALQDAVMMAEKIRSAVMETPLRAGETQIPTTISSGVAQRLAHESAETFFKRVDQALFRAKEKGRNRTEGARHYLER